MKVVRFLVGGMLGLLAGAVFGFAAVAWWTSRSSPVRVAGQSVGWDPLSLMHEPGFAAVVLLSALAFAYLFARLLNRIGRRWHSQV